MLDGFETLEQLEKEGDSVGKNFRPLNEIIITGTTILANPIADKEWQEKEDNE